MHNLLGERFLKLFAGDLQHRLKRGKLNVHDQNPAAKAEGAAEPVAPASEEGHEMNLTEGNHLPNEAKQEE